MPWRKPSRFWRHLFTDHGSVRRAFSNADLARIEQAIGSGEHRHCGQVQFAIEPALPLGRVLRQLPPRERALEVFGQLRTWDTEENCGVLVYVLLADRAVEIIADRGIHRHVGDAAWTEVCGRMESAFGDGHYADAVAAGIDEINALLAQHYPREGPAGVNELPDRPILL
jgi:uncharacterized membrane protein